MLSNVLRTITERHVNEITREVVSALRKMPLQDLSAFVTGETRNGVGVDRLTRSPRPRSAGVARSVAPRLPRRSPKQIARGVEHVVAIVKKHKGGLSAEVIRAKLAIDKRALPKLLQDGVKTGKLRKAGQRRGTKYRAA